MEIVTLPNSFIVASIIACVTMELFVLGLICKFIYHRSKCCNNKKSCNKCIFMKANRKNGNYSIFLAPYYIWGLAPYLLICGLHHSLHYGGKYFMEKVLKKEGILETSILVKIVGFLNDHLKYYFGLLSIILIIIGCLSFLIWLHKNLRYNLSIRFLFTGRCHKLLRFLNTMASIFLLIGMVIGISSIFIEKFDIIFEPSGILKNLMDDWNSKRHKIEPIHNKLKEIFEKIDLEFDCKKLYESVGSTAAIVGILTLLLPQANSYVNIGSKAAYYIARTANSLTTFATRLKRITQQLFRIILYVAKFASFTTRNFKKIIIGSNSSLLGQILPILPSFVCGVYALFGAFWPNQVIFFSAKQRRKYMSDQLWTWTLALIILIVSCLINTLLLDEIVKLLNGNIGFFKVMLEHRLGWKLAMIASSFSLLGSFLNWIVALIWTVTTHINHINLTKAEEEWKNELDRRELVTVDTPQGKIILGKKQLKYRKSRLSPWTWILPIFVTLFACGFGILANFYPKFEMTKEPKAALIKYIDKIFEEIFLFEMQIDNVKNDANMECFPLATLGDVFTLNPNFNHFNLLMAPIENFKNITQDFMKPLKDTLSGYQKQLILDINGINEQTFGGNITNIWKDNDLQFIGLLFTIPRFICLFILIFGCIMASCIMCTNDIYESVEPKKLIDAYGIMTVLSLIYIIGAQLSLFNILSSFGIPFYHIYVRFGPGFIYDVVADVILLATYIGMKNELFFAIPKRRTFVWYSIPGASELGPNIQGQII